ncbi:MAG: hypothetical protein LBL81_06105 [Tannerella sp.]|jgi:biotin transporter BioY|nr:hypothetical protein [Tannerella sp.]
MKKKTLYINLAIALLLWAMALIFCDDGIVRGIAGFYFLFSGSLLGVERRKRMEAAGMSSEERKDIAVKVAFVFGLCILAAGGAYYVENLLNKKNAWIISTSLIFFIGGIVAICIIRHSGKSKAS